jgi:hypothetical protein
MKTPFTAAQRSRGLVQAVMLALLVSLVGALALPDSASAAPGEPTLGHIRSALDRIANDTWTESDISLLKRAPEITKHVPDPRDEGESGITVKRIPVPKATSSSTADVEITACYSAHAWVKKKDIFGTTVYRFNTETDWCGRRGRVTSIERAVGYLDQRTFGISLSSYEYDTHGIRSNGNGFHNKKANVDYCVPYIGCYDQTHPWINVALTETLEPGSWGVASNAG